MQAISIIKREHQRLGSVLFTLKALVKEIEDSGKPVPFRVFHLRRGISVKFAELHAGQIIEAGPYALEEDEINRTCLGVGQGSAAVLVCHEHS